MTHDLKSGRCPKCASQDIVPDLALRDINQFGVSDLTTQEVADNPGALIFKGEAATGTVKAWICGDCGYTELYTTNHRQLYNIYRRREDSKKHG